MNEELPWKLLLKPIRKYYPKAGNDRRPISPEVMLQGITSQRTRNEVREERNSVILLHENAHW